MDDASGKFALVMLRANQVRVHHKRRKHEYVFGISDGRLQNGRVHLASNFFHGAGTRHAISDDDRCPAR
jgi:hypothetical protein